MENENKNNYGTALASYLADFYRYDEYNFWKRTGRLYDVQVSSNYRNTCPLPCGQTHTMQLHRYPTGDVAAAKCTNCGTLYLSHVSEEATPHTSN